MVPYTQTNGKEIIYSETVIPFTNSDNKIVVQLHERVTIELKFVDGEGTEQDNKISIKVDDERTKLMIEAYNFKNSLGTVTSKAIHVGTIENKNIYLNFAAYDISGIKIVHITFYKDR